MAKTNVRGGRPQWELRRLLRRLASCRKLQPYQAYAVVHLIQSPRTRGIGNRHRFDVPSGTNGLRRFSRAESEKSKPTRNRSTKTTPNIIFIFSNENLFLFIHRNHKNSSKSSLVKNYKFTQSKYSPTEKTLAKFLIFPFSKMKRKPFRNRDLNIKLTLHKASPLRNEQTLNKQKQLPMPTQTPAFHFLFPPFLSQSDMQRGIMRTFRRAKAHRNAHCQHSEETTAHSLEQDTFVLAKCYLHSNKRKREENTCSSKTVKHHHNEQKQHLQNVASYETQSTEPTQLTHPQKKQKTKHTQKSEMNPTVLYSSPSPPPPLRPSYTYCRCPRNPPSTSPPRS
jgi:hypothetical protein